MVDSSGKVPPSLLRGNINQLGDFDQCVSVHGVMENNTDVYASAEAIYGKYCLASIDVTLPLSMKTINNLIHSHYVIRSRLTDVSVLLRVNTAHFVVLYLKENTVRTACRTRVTFL